MEVSLPVGLLLGLVLALLLHYMNDTIHDERDLLAIEGVEFLGHFSEPEYSDDLAIRLTSKKA
jgi:capsular polysaccharide biosynthesis protein